ncbi:uncharacterized protein At4g17910-like [Homalodisca vitripennis]|uniref:uncharacterized protein At4g17910-like n=1 Tax=Homalodisca vitripennis TaxID=197043 RepID=UPI001EE9F7F0|nr:uncharacterized protein At4g17910-like [Homalodisca vitripennis]
MDIETIVGIDSKKELHEEFVRNMNGTTISEVYVLTLPFHVYTIVVALAGVLFGRFHLICDSSDDPPCKCHRVPANKLNIFVKEMLCLALPLLLTSTILSERPVSTPLVLVLAVIVASVVGNIMRVNTVSCVFHWQYDDYPRLVLNPYRRSFVTCCRSMCSICAMITMLAVDFHVFPRKFAKTATYGYSFMDAGVGLFVLSNAVVESADGIRSGLKRTFQTSSALFSFGVIRYYAIEQFNYQNPVGEYGVHWNFFFTLAVVKIFCYCILRFGNFSDNIFIYIVEISLMQLVFWGVDLESYVLSDSPRTDWVDANREGLFSLMGFTSLYLFGVYLNKILMKTSGSITSDCRMLGELLFYSAVTLVVTLNIHEVMPASRRAANLTYVTWIMSLAMLQFTAALAVEIFLVGLLFGNKRNKYCLTTPFIYESINYNRMTFFLLSNLLTGLINIMFDTLEMNAFESLVVLIAYVIVNCGVLFYFYVKRIKLKFY